MRTIITASLLTIVLTYTVLLLVGVSTSLMYYTIFPGSYETHCTEVIKLEVFPVKSIACYLSTEDN